VGRSTIAIALCATGCNALLGIHEFSSNDALGPNDTMAIGAIRDRRARDVRAVERADRVRENQNV